MLASIIPACHTRSSRRRKAFPRGPCSGLSSCSLFLILAALYESWTLPFSCAAQHTIAILGAYLALHMRSFENDIFATIGLVMLIGLSAKNAILIVEFAKLNYDSGQEHLRVGAECRAGSLPPHRHDGAGFHCRLSAPCGGQRLRRCFAANSGHRGCGRNDALHGARTHLHPGHVFGGRVSFAPIREGRRGCHHGLRT